MAKKRDPEPLKAEMAISSPNTAKIFVPPTLVALEP